MKKIIFVIVLLIIFPIMINSIYSEKTIDELLESADLKSSENSEQSFHDAIKDYEEVLEIDSDNVFALNGIGAMLLLLNEIDEAEPFIDRALEVDPEFVSALSNKSIILQYNGEKELAIEMFERALEIEPDNLQTLFNKANLLKGLDVDASLGTLDRIIKLDPGNQNAIAQKDNLLNSLREIRVDGYLQMALRDKNGILIGYAESDVIFIKNSTYVEFYLFQTSTQVNELLVDGKKYFNFIMGDTLLMPVDKLTPSKSGISLHNILIHKGGQEIKYTPVIARTHGYLTEEGDVIEQLLQIVVPQRNTAEQISD